MSNVDVSKLWAPFRLEPLNHSDGTFRFIKPAALKIFGSHSVGTSLTPNIKIDIALVLGKVSKLFYILILHKLLFVANVNFYVCSYNNKVMLCF